MGLISFIEALLIAAALHIRPSSALLREHYESALDYYLAQTAELLGNYSLLFLIEALLAFILIIWVKEKGYQRNYGGWGLPVFFGFCLLLGQSYHEAGDWSYCFGGAVNAVHFAIALAGYSFLFRRLIALFLCGYGKLAETSWGPRIVRSFFGEHCFRNVFLTLLAAWTPVILVSFPGNVSYDAYGQICQVLGTMPYSTHHPLLHTLFMGGTVKLFYLLTGACETGVFVYIICQALMLGAALAYTIGWLKKENRSSAFLALMLGIYLFAPVYSNYVSTAIKDIPYAAAVVWYVVLLAEGVEHRDVLKTKRYQVLFTVAALLCALLRNNGIYLVLPTGMAASLIWCRGEAGRKLPRYMVTFCLLPAILYVLVSQSLCAATGAERGSVGEMLSLPFQQTARCLQRHGDELTSEERAAIEAVLGDVDYVAARYNPSSADAVKSLYRKDASGGELMSYIGVWAKLIFKYPASYLEAFFHHVYGLFDPAVSNSVRCEIYEEDFFVRRGLFHNADKVLIFLYRFADRISILSILQNAGGYVWALLVLCGVMLRRRRDALLLAVPLLVSLLVCMAAPCFFGHVRYAFPIMFTIPFLYGVTAGRTGKQEERG